MRNIIPWSLIHQRTAYVVAFKFPYSEKSYDTMCRIFTAERFKLINPAVPEMKPLEIFVAPTLLELQKITGVPMLAPARIEAKEEDDEPAARCLDAPAAGASAGEWMMVPARLWESRAACVAEAAALARAWEQRRLMRAARELPTEVPRVPSPNAQSPERTLDGYSLVQCMAWRASSLAMGDAAAAGEAGRQGYTEEGIPLYGERDAWRRRREWGEHGRLDAWTDASRRMERLLAWGLAAARSRGRRRDGGGEATDERAIVSVAVRATRERPGAVWRGDRGPGHVASLAPPVILWAAIMLAARTTARRRVPFAVVHMFLGLTHPFWQVSSELSRSPAALCAAPLHSFHSAREPCMERAVPMLPMLPWRVDGLARRSARRTRAECAHHTSRGARRRRFVLGWVDGAAAAASLCSTLWRGSSRGSRRGIRWSRMHGRLCRRRLSTSSFATRPGGAIQQICRHRAGW
jgi:hypothetical protein